MKLFKVLIVLIIFASCIDRKEKKNIVFDDDNLNLSDSLRYHLSNAMVNLENNIGIEDSLSSDVYLISFGFIQEANNDYYLALELNNNITEDIVTKYTFGLEIYVYEEDREYLLPYSKSKSRLYDLRPFTPDLLTVNNNKYVIREFGKLTLKRYDKIVFYLYPRSGYEGKISGRKLELIDYTL